MDLSKAVSFPVIADPKDFDQKSGNRLERLIFNNRKLVVIACAIITTFFAFQVFRGIHIDAGYDKMLPRDSAYIKAFLENRDQLRGLGDSVRVVVENPTGDIFNKDYLNTLGKINDEIFLLHGVDRA